MKKIQGKKIKIDSIQSRNLRNYLFVGALISMIFATPTYAATPGAELGYDGQETIVKTEAEAPKTWAQKISGSASAKYSVKAYETQGNTDRDSVGYTLGVGYQLTKLYSVSTSIAIYNNQDEIDEREQLKLEGMSVDLDREGIDLPNNFKITPSLSVSLPVGRDTVKRESLIFGLNPNAKISLPVKDWTGWGKFGSSVLLSSFYNVHEYKNTAEGKSNAQYGYSTALSVGYELLKDFSVSASGGYNSSWTYNGTQVEALTIGEKVNWKFHKNASASVGHSNRGALFAYSGVNYDFSLLSERSSYFSGELTVSF